MLQEVGCVDIVSDMENNTETNAIVNSVIRSLEQQTYSDLVNDFGDDQTTALEFALNGGWDLPEADVEINDVDDFESEDDILRAHGY